MKKKNRRKKGEREAPKMRNFKTRIGFWNFRQNILQRPKLNSFIL